jgi:hypothetical protein
LTQDVCFDEVAGASPPLKRDPLVRLLVCDVVGEAVMGDGKATVRDDVTDIHARDR